MGCLSRIPDPYLPIPDPDFYPSRISDPKTATKERGEGDKKICCHTFYCSHKFHKIEYYFIFEMMKKKNFGQFSKNYGTFYPKICHYGFGIRDPGSDIRDPGSGKKPIPDPGSGSRGQKAPDPRSRIRIRNAEHNTPAVRYLFQEEHSGVVEFYDTGGFIIKGRAVHLLT
jgi:hypothetical protein